MSLSGKKLQEIYDGGVLQLSEMEATISGVLRKISEDESEARGNGDNSAQAKIEDKSKHLHAELKQFHAESVERLQKTIDSELQETREHVVQLTSDLNSLVERMRKQIVTLQAAHEHSLVNLRQNLGDQFEGLIENSNSDLGQQEFVVTKRLRTYGTLIINSLQQKLDQSLWESRGEERQYNTALFKAFMAKANSIDTHFAALMQKLTEEFETQFKTLEGQAQQAESHFYDETKGLLEKVGEHAQITEKEIQDFYKKETNAHTTRLDRSLNDQAQELSGVHDSTTNELGSRTKELSKSLLTSSGEVREALTKKVVELNEKIDKMMSQFNDKVQKLTSGSIDLRQGLEKEKSEIFTSLKEELSNIRSGFESRLTKLLKDGLDKIDKAENEAKIDIEKTQKKCLTELDKTTQSVKGTFENTVSEFLDKIAVERDKALREIETSAGSPNSASNTSKKTGTKTEQ
jgi:gas vesicle protein